MLLVKQMENFKIDSLIDDLTQGVTCNGQPVDIDEEFKGDIAGLIKLIKFSLEKNIGPFTDWPEMMGLSFKVQSPAKDQK
jgi:hypothetical protein